ncbi:MAG: hypothetical protein GX601_13640 [Anaerolineales bacterium]|nr:hypothetical protein [Anaerolineales bacterium]
MLFSLYIPEALEDKLGFPILAALVPEFPVRIGTIYPDIVSDKSYKIDYLAVSASREQPVFVELKTEGMSRRATQDRYLIAAQRVGMSRLIDGVLEIFRATQAKRKYFALLLLLQDMGLLAIPDELFEIMAGASLQGASCASRSVRVLTEGMEMPQIVYIQPQGEQSDVISFHQFSTVVRRHPDRVSQRFAQSLQEWASIHAGDGTLIQSRTGL